MRTHYINHFCKSTMNKANGEYKINRPAAGSTLNPESHVSSMHTDGANFAKADGSVIFLLETIDPATYEALGTASGGEPVSF